MKYLIGCMLFLSIAFQANGQDQEYDLEKLFDISTRISDIAMGKNGMIWVTTWSDGLYKYDGNELVNVNSSDYQYTDSTSLSSKVLSSLVVDSTNNLWIGTDYNGLEYYDVITGQFNHFKSDTSISGSIAGNRIRDLLIDHSNNLWVGTDNGLSIRKRQSRSFESHFMNKNVTNIYEDHNHNIWISFGSKINDYWISEGGGLAFYDSKRDTLEILIETKAENGSFGDVHVDKKGNVWVTVDNKGVGQLNLQDKTIHYSKALSKKNRRYNSLYIDKYDQLWIGSWNAGNEKLEIFDTENKRIVKSFDFSADGYLYDPRFDISLVSGGESSRVKGLYIIKSPNKLKLPWVYTSATWSYPFSLNGNILLIGSSDEGLIQKSLISGESRAWNQNELADFTIPQLKAVSSFAINESIQTIWLGSITGLYRIEYNLVDDPPFFFPKYIRNYRRNPEEKSLISDSTYGLLLDGETTWIANAKGLSSYNILNEEFTHYSIDIDFNQPHNSSVFFCLEKEGDNIWVGSENGILLFDVRTESFKHYNSSIGAIYNIHIDTIGTIWAGGEKGLFHYDRKTDEFIKLGKDQLGVDLYSIVRILEDGKNNLWLSANNNKVIRIDKSRKSALLFDQTGIEKGENIDYINYNDDIFLGSLYRYYHIDPDDYESLDIPAPILNFTDLKINGKHIKPGNESTLKKPLNQTEEVYLAYDQNTFSIEFFGADYYFNQTPEFRFKLEGYNENWNDLGDNNQVFFFQVPPDDYNLKIIAVSKTGLKTQKELKITIGKPWWRSTWAYLMYIILIGFFIWTTHKVQRRRTLIKERDRVKDERLAQAKEVEAAYDKLKSTQNQLIHSEKMASLGELTAGIAHEIQNPLNFVNNFSDLNNELLDDLKEAIQSNDQEEISAIFKDLKENEGKITYHGKRAEEIVKSMLQHSRTGTGEKEPTDINTLADEYLRLAYHGLRAKDKSGPKGRFNAEFKTELDPNLPKVNVVPQDMGRVLLNLINNAFQAVSQNPSHPEPVEGSDEDSHNKTLREPQRDSPLVVVSTKTIPPSKGGQGDYEAIQITVTDNGPGIPKEIQDKIFQPFFTTKETGQGTGLGLSMSYDIVTKGHGGTLKVTSQPGQTQFMVTLPYR